MGVKDSKDLSPQRREELFEKLTASYETHVVIVQPDEIDRWVLGKKGLNRLEATIFGDILNHLRPDTAYLDCCDVSPENFRKHVTTVLSYPCKMVIEHKADSTYPVVGAASIIAKVTRDRQIEKLKEKHGDLGSGYPSDKKTIAFLKKWYDREGQLPDFARKSWSLAFLKGKKAHNMRLDEF